MMKLLLTSSGINNTSIQDALVDLLGKPIAESNALFIPTATPLRRAQTLVPFLTKSSGFSRRYVAVLKRVDNESCLLQ
jgi:peptidase E